MLLQHDVHYAKMQVDSEENLKSPVNRSYFDAGNYTPDKVLFAADTV